MTMARRSLGVLLASALVLTAACGGDDDSAEGTDTGDEAAADGTTLQVPDDVVEMDGTEVEVDSLDNTFRVQNIQVAPGATVVWTNVGRNDHDVLPVEGDDWGAEVEDFGPGDVYEHTFDEPGVYPYYCSIHGTTTAGMVGTVVVAE